MSIRTVIILQPHPHLVTAFNSKGDNPVHPKSEKFRKSSFCYPFLQ